MTDTINRFTTQGELLAGLADDQGYIRRYNLSFDAAPSWGVMLYSWDDGQLVAKVDDEHVKPGLWQALGRQASTLLNPDQICWLRDQLKIGNALLDKRFTGFHETNHLNLRRGSLDVDLPLAVWNPVNWGRVPTTAWLEQGRLKLELPNAIVRDVVALVRADIRQALGL